MCLCDPGEEFTLKHDRICEECEETLRRLRDIHAPPQPKEKADVHPMVKWTHEQ